MTCLGVWITALLSLSPSLAVAAEGTPVELTPYRVELILSFECVPEFSPEFREVVSRDIRRTVGRTVGERWAVTVTSSLDGGLRDLASLTPESAPVSRRPALDGAKVGMPEAGSPDKLFFIGVARDGPGYLVSSREWDRLTDALGPVQAGHTQARGELPRIAVATICAAFRPIATVEPASDGAKLTLKAGAIPSPDPSVAAISAGTLFTSYLRKQDRHGLTTEIKPVPYTYLETTKQNSGVVETVLHSALRKPLAGKRGRVETWAVAAPAIEPATRFVVIRRGDLVPLTGRAVEVRSRPAEPGKEIPPAERTLLTDRSGSVTLPVDRDRPLVWLTVKSGDVVLMRLPLAPGVDREIILPVGDDQRRIDAESRIAIITGELIETVAKRATLLAKARAGARTGKYEQAEAALREAAALPDVASFRRRIAAIEAPAAEAADEAGDRMAAARIRALGRKTVALVDRYLTPETLRTATEEVEELKRTDPDHVPQKPAPAAPTSAATAPTTDPSVPGASKREPGAGDRAPILDR